VFTSRFHRPQVKVDMILAFRMVDVRIFQTNVARPDNRYRNTTEQADLAQIHLEIFTGEISVSYDSIESG
jgi:hypothetical protein